MITPFPVPSKGALRLLRQIAYAGSFAGSIGGGAVILEDRRRRICAAREIHETTRKLKSSRKYHSAASAAENERDSSSEHAIYKHWDINITPEDDPSRTPFLPSEINKAYESVHFPSSASHKHHKERIHRSEKHQLREDFADNSDVAVGNRSKAEDVAVVGGSDLTPHSPQKLHKFVPRGIDEQLSNTALKNTPPSNNNVIEKDSAQTGNLSSTRPHTTSGRESSAEAIATVEKPGSQSNPESLLQHIDTRLARKDTRNAVALFLETFSNQTSTELRPRFTKLAFKLASAALQEKKYNLVENIFWRMRELNALDWRCWSLMLKALAEQKQHRQLIDIFKDWRGTFRPNDESHVPAMQAFVAHSKLGEAEEILQSASKQNSSQLRASYVVLLSGIWRATRDLERTKALFSRMLSWSADFRPSVALYNSLIRSCVESHQEEQAEAYVLEMKEKWSLQPNIRTLGHFVLSKAQKQDWPGVQNSLDNLKSTGLIAEAKTPAALLNPLLIAYGRQGNSKDLVSFSRTIIEAYELRPDQSTSDIVVGILAENGLVSEIEEWMEYTRQQGFNLKLDAQSFGQNLERFWARNKNGATTRVEKLHFAHRQLKRSAVNDEALHGIRKVIARWKSQRPRKLNSKPLKDAPNEKLEMGVGVRGVHRQMDLAMIDGRPAEAVRIYERAVADGVVISRQLLETAVEASLRATGDDFAQAHGLVLSARESGLKTEDALTPLFIHHLYQSASHIRRHVGEDLKTAVLNVYRTMEQHGLPIKHHVAITAANRLINQGKPSEAISLLTNIKSLPLYESTPFDIVGMTTFLRAYVQLHQVAGIQWVLHTVFSTDMPIDEPFVDVLKKAKSGLRAIMTSHGVQHHSHASSSHSSSASWAINATSKSSLSQRSLSTVPYSPQMVHDCRRFLKLLDTWVVEVSQRKKYMEAESARQQRAIVKLIKKTSSSPSSSSSTPLSSSSSSSASASSISPPPTPSSSRPSINVPTRQRKSLKTARKPSKHITPTESQPKPTAQSTQASSDNHASSVVSCEA
ncbi:hypothetical protein L228DRAFT_268308 [Xylona heveae TC161]|uniref:Pentacotripeptide-repeat region of PRORP domain-containing protein n=1 Tax=Xylona heveae (strain CBS 132557 / TC161) TaxID=1328760 RepID=A0A165H3N0_XYLHT|nr:hypothetical protein L228DRAFT_268308 [Xylona heveae TC161]KZF22940.1 hypothetical protein L228DRAFT_268308 [Xylona heveae TC161]